MADPAAPRAPACHALVTTHTHRAPPPPHPPPPPLARPPPHRGHPHPLHLHPLLWRTIGVIYSSWAIGVQAGAFSFESFAPSGGLASFPRTLVFTPGDTSDWHWWFQSTSTANYTELYIPIWLPLLLTAIPTLLIWRTHLRLRHRERRGKCPTCGYDLAGLPNTSTCPECGTVRD